MTNDASVQTVLHALPAALPLPTEPDTDPSVHSVPHVRRTSRSPPEISVVCLAKSRPQRRIAAWQRSGQLPQAAFMLLRQLGKGLA